MAIDEKTGFLGVTGDQAQIASEEDHDPILNNGSTPDAAGLIQSVSLRSGYGQLKSAATAAFFGINHRGAGNPIPLNTDQYGLTFFTRPRLNLSYDNITRDRTLAPMMSMRRDSIPRAIRAYLDPVGARLGNPFGGPDGIAVAGAASTTAYPSTLVDDQSAFISILTNNLVSMTGWPDPYTDTYTSKSGLYKEEWSMIDGIAKIYNKFSLSTNFRNIVGDPISYLFYVWTQYASLVHEGVLDPRPEMVVENEIDYQTRVYRLILDPTRTYVQKMAACGVAFPLSISIGASFNYSDDKTFNADNDQVSVEFQAMGAIYMDPILIKEFNDTVVMFNQAMHDSTRRSTYVKLESVYKPLFNYIGYPRIDPFTMELEWWVTKGDFQTIMGDTSLLGNTVRPLSK
jgi:hypothetical protein